jgi:hypothetical protein
MQIWAGADTQIRIGSLKDCPSAPTSAGLFELPAGCFMLVGLPQ